MSYYIDILEPDADTGVAIDKMGQAVGRLYARSWDKAKSQHYSGKQFDLNIQALAMAWVSKQLKIFVAVDEDTKEAVGFLAAVAYRPLYYNAQVLHIQDWFTDGDAQMEHDLFAYALRASRIIGCDEVWIQNEADFRPENMDDSWKLMNTYTTLRYVKQ